MAAILRQLPKMNAKRWALILGGLLLALAMCAMLAAALFGLGLS